MNAEAMGPLHILSFTARVDCQSRLTSNRARPLTNWERNGLKQGSGRPLLSQSLVFRWFISVCGLGSWSSLGGKVIVDGKGPDNGSSPAYLPTEGHTKSLCIPGKFLSVFTFAIHRQSDYIISYFVFFHFPSLLQRSFPWPSWWRHSHSRFSLETLVSSHCTFHSIFHSGQFTNKLCK